MSIIDAQESDGAILLYFDLPEGAEHESMIIIDYAFDNKLSDIIHEKDEATDRAGRIFIEHTFHIPDTNVTVTVQPQFNTLEIDANGIRASFNIADSDTCDRIIDIFKEVISFIKHQRLNTVNKNSHPVPSNIRALIGSYLTGHSGTIEQQRNAISNNAQGGKRKTRKHKQRKQRKTRIHREQRKQRK